MSVEINTIVKQLTIAKKFYYDGKPIMSDDDFDMLELKLKSLDPNNAYFQNVGAPVIRGHKVKHEIPMGSLNQVDATALQDWLATSPKSDVIVSDKLDGNSIALYYDETGSFSRAVTRGDGIEGLDVTRHFKRMFALGNNSIPQSIPVDVPVVVRAEAIFAVEKFKRYVTGYKNPRNYVAGQLNRTVADETFLRYVDVVAFDLTGLNLNKLDSLSKLDEFGFNVVTHFTIPPSERTSHIGTEDILVEKLQEEKVNSIYELDGLVIEFNDIETRNAQGFDNLNPRYAVKFKINVNFVETEVIKVEWNPSKDGYLKPRVQFEPIELAGVTISFATGFNAKFIMDNKIGPGAVIRVARSGDVIPHISEVIKPTQADLPNQEDWDGGFYWSQSNTDIILYKKPAASVIKEITEFFTSIGAPQLKIGSVTTLYELGYTTIESIIKLSEDELTTALGENGVKVFNGLRDKLTDIDEYVLAGSLPFFGRGIGKRKMKALAEAYGDLSSLTYEQIVNTSGFDEISAQKVADAIPAYNKFLADLKDYISVKRYIQIAGDLNGIAVCFTGVRSAELEKIIESRGGKVLSSITKQTTHLVAKDPNGKSGKLDKARAANVTVISLEQAKEMWT